jgi:hypothetical protein
MNYNSYMQVFDKCPNVEGMAESVVGVVDLNAGGKAYNYC